MNGRAHTIAIDPATCVGCVDCCKICPTKAIRVREGLAVVDPELCIDCGACLRACRHHAVLARTSSTSDLKKFKHTVAVPSLTLFAQFGRDVEPGRVLKALTAIGFDATYDLSWMCEMLAGAIDAHLSAGAGPWPKISVTCPAIVRLIQLRYPDLVAHLVPIETARELAAKLLRRKLAYELKLAPEEIGIFFITPCSAIVNSIHHPEGLKESYLDGAFAISEVFGPLLQAVKSLPDGEGAELVSSRGLREAVTRKKEGEAILARLPRKDCAACGAPDCATLAQDVVRGKAAVEQCVFVRLEHLEQDLRSPKDLPS